MLQIVVDVGVVKVELPNHVANGLLLVLRSTENLLDHHRIRDPVKLSRLVSQFPVDFGKVLLGEERLQVLADIRPTPGGSSEIGVVVDGQVFECRVVHRESLRSVHHVNHDTGIMPVCQQLFVESLDFLSSDQFT